MCACASAHQPARIRAQTVAAAPSAVNRRAPLLSAERRRQPRRQRLPGPPAVAACQRWPVATRAARIPANTEQRPMAGNALPTAGTETSVKKGSHPPKQRACEHSTAGLSGKEFLRIIAPRHATARHVLSPAAYNMQTPVIRTERRLPQKAYTTILELDFKKNHWFSSASTYRDFIRARRRGQPRRGACASLVRSLLASVRLCSPLTGPLPSPLPYSAPRTGHAFAAGQRERCSPCRTAPPAAPAVAEV